jgi:hypothetical protein
MCCGCGAAFQAAFPDAPGFLPPDQLNTFVERRMGVYKERKDKLQQQKREEEEKKSKLQQQAAEGENPAAEGDGASAADGSSNPKWSSMVDPNLVRQAKLDPSRPLSEQDLSLALNHSLIREDELYGLPEGVSPDMIMTKRDLRVLERRERDEERERKGLGTALRCLRCFQLANYGYTRGQVSSVRAEDFRLLLRSRFLERGGRSNVILKVVDLFDFHGSFIKDFASIAGGRNPVILVANKVDLLPRGFGENRLRAWIKAEADKYGLHFHSIHLVSALTGHNVFKLLRAAQALAEPDALLDRPRRDIYLVGMTNSQFRASLLSRKKSRVPRAEC